MRLFILFCSFFLYLVPTYCLAGKVEIKGFYLSAPRHELQARWGKSLDMVFFTVGGVPTKSKEKNVYLNFVDEKLEVFVFYFDPDSFESVYKTVNTKYPGMKCISSVVTNAMNAKFNQKECSMEIDNGTLLISKYTSDLTTSSLSMISPIGIKKIHRDASKDVNDI